MNRRFTPVRALTDAVRLFTDPSTIIKNIDQDAPLWLPAGTIIFWGFIAGSLDALATLAGLRVGSGEVLNNAMMLVLGPIFFLAVSALLTPLYHLLALASGGLAPLSTSFRILSTLIPLMTLDVLFGPIMVVRLGMLTYKFYLAALAAEYVHGALPHRARWVFGTVFILLFLLNLWILA